ncbi:hypothetical protein GCM10023116_48220 [Kistimonas scapharcae]|uniref:50S ribosomal protein L29 n=1 Tax=Kistimonas scapharcae TaxID=1036133 RepID=A0ABP8VAF0_9GAMM
MNLEQIRKNLDPLTAQYIDMLNAERKAELDALRETVNREFRAIKQRLDELGQHSITQHEVDKYSLTKAKVIRLMKQLGIYEDKE